MKQPTPTQIKAVMSYLGQRKSKAKSDAARRNGRLGGRPVTKQQPLRDDRGLEAL
jgi:hypothetical protein